MFNFFFFLYYIFYYFLFFILVIYKKFDNLFVDSLVYLPNHLLSQGLTPRTIENQHLRRKSKIFVFKRKCFFSTFFSFS